MSSRSCCRSSGWTSKRCSPAPPTRSDRPSTPERSMRSAARSKPPQSVRRRSRASPRRLRRSRSARRARATVSRRMSKPAPKRTGLVRFFGERRFCADMVANPKPAPMVCHLAAARTLRVSTAHCLVVEDSVTGVTAARAAGMAVLGFIGGGRATEGTNRCAAARGRKRRFRRHEATARARGRMAAKRDFRDSLTTWSLIERLRIANRTSTGCMEK